MMFSSKTAWFSASCAPEPSELWVDHGGKLADDSLAQFIFSDDWEHEDTCRFMTSEAYLKQHLAIFHSTYVSEAVTRGLPNVILGSYLLVPKDIQKCLASGRTIVEEDSSDSDGEVQDRSLSKKSVVGRKSESSAKTSCPLPTDTGGKIHDRGLSKKSVVGRKSESSAKTSCPLPTDAGGKIQDRSLSEKSDTERKFETAAGTSLLPQTADPASVRIKTRASGQRLDGGALSASRIAGQTEGESQSRAGVKRSARGLDKSVAHLPESLGRDERGVSTTGPLDRLIKWSAPQRPSSNSLERLLKEKVSGIQRVSNVADKEPLFNRETSIPGIAHVDNLPKVSGVLHTLNVKSPAVSIRERAK